jgi:hypothetical protein
MLRAKFLRAILFLSLWFKLLQGEAGIILELPDQKARGFLVSIAQSVVS